MIPGGQRRKPRLRKMLCVWSHSYLVFSIVRGRSLSLCNSNSSDMPVLPPCILETKQEWGRRVFYSVLFLVLQQACHWILLNVEDGDTPKAERDLDLILEAKNHVDVICCRTLVLSHILDIWYQGILSHRHLHPIQTRLPLGYWWWSSCLYFSLHRFFILLPISNDQIQIQHPDTRRTE